jgi:hypothetical protein
MHLFPVCILFFLAAGGCNRLRSPQAMPLNGGAAQPPQNIGSVSDQAGLVQEEFTVEGITGDDGEPKPITPYGDIHLRIAFRVDDPAVDETLLAMPVIYLRRQHYVRPPKVKQEGYVDVIYNGAFPKKSRDGNRVILDVVMRAPSKSGTFRAEVIDGAHAGGTVLASNPLIVNEVTQEEWQRARAAAGFTAR